MSEIDTSSAGKREALDAHDVLLAVLEKWAGATGAGRSNDAGVAEDFSDTAHRGEGAVAHDPIIDAEHLLTFLLPQNAIERFTIPQGENEFFSKTLESKLARLTAEKESKQEAIFGRILSLLLQYLVRHLDIEGKEPLFGAASYVRWGDEDANAGREDRPAIDSMDFTEAYSFSVTLCVMAMSLAARIVDSKTIRTLSVIHKKSSRINFDQWRAGKIEAIRKHETGSPGWVDAIHGLDRNEKIVLISDLASRRLTAAMTGLIASFSVTEIDRLDWEKRTRRRWSRHGDRLNKLRPRFKALGYDNWETTDKAMECGWSWGPVAELPKGRLTGDRTADNVMEEARMVSKDAKVHAENAPYFYFTITALDAIQDLNSEDLKIGELLTAVQSDLANRLTNLADLTQKYWGELAFGSADDGLEWPVASLPWSPSDTDVKAPENASSVYWNLYLLRIADMSSVSSKSDIARWIELLKALADTSRITSPEFPPGRDPAVHALHFGLSVGMQGVQSQDGTERRVHLKRIISDFAPQLLKVCGRVLQATSDNDQREAIVRLSTSIWSHLVARADEARSEGPFRWDSGLSWDYASGPFRDYADTMSGASPADFNPKSVSSWSYTERVVEALVAYAEAQLKRPARDPQLRSMAYSMIAELEYELKKNSAKLKDAPGLQKQLDHARRDAEERAAIALGAAMNVAQMMSDQLS